MTRVSRLKAARPGANTLRAILSRLVVALAFVLFGVPQLHADVAVAHAGPAAQSQIEQAMGIPSTQRYLLRAQVPDDTSPDAVVPGADDAAWPLRAAAAISPAPLLSFLLTEIGVLPPVRGPPAV